MLIFEFFSTYFTLPQTIRKETGSFFTLVHKLNPKFGTQPELARREQRSENATANNRKTEFNRTVEPHFQTSHFAATASRPHAAA